MKAHVGVGLCQVVGDCALVAGQGVVFLIKKWFSPLLFHRDFAGKCYHYQGDVAPGLGGGWVQVQVVKEGKVGVDHVGDLAPGGVHRAEHVLVTPSSSSRRPRFHILISHMQYCKLVRKAR